MTIIRRPEVERITGLSRSTIYAYMADDEFPQNFKIGRKAVAWRREDIEDWIHKKYASN